MKFFLITMVALVGLAAAVQVPDSATQGPNPQDIATPEPEYIDIDEPEPVSSGASSPSAAAPAPVPIQSRNFAPAPPRPVQRPVTFTAAATNARLIAQSYSSPQRQYQPIVHHQQPIVHQQQSYVHHQQPIVYQQPIVQHHQPIVQYQQQLPGHSFSSLSGYQYRRPVQLRRLHRYRY